MGYFKQHTIVVCSFDGNGLRKVHKKAKQIFKEEFAKDTDVVYDGSLLVGDIINGVSNGVQSFFIAPDGSKEGWHPSNLGDMARERIVAYIERYGMVYYVEVFFGEDYKSCEVVNHN